jgi:hypothetical protein
LAESELVSTGRSSFSWRHLNRKMRPYTGLRRQHMCEQAELQSRHRKPMGSSKVCAAVQGCRAAGHVHASQLL